MRSSEDPLSLECFKKWHAANLCEERELACRSGCARNNYGDEGHRKCHIISFRARIDYPSVMKLSE